MRPDTKYYTRPHVDMQQIKTNNGFFIKVYQKSVAFNLGQNGQ